MDVLVQVAQLVLALTILVFIHELGHFLAARAFGIRVDKFYIFFDAWGKKIYSFKRGNTEYGIGWLPLGGYVKIAGMVDESMDKEQMKKEPESWEFRTKPNWQKFIVMIAGITMNIILGVIIFIVYLSHFEKSYTPISEINKDGIYAYEEARNMGFQTGDKLIAVNGKHYDRFQDYVGNKVLFGADVTVNRNGKDTTISVSKDLINKIIAGTTGFIESRNIVKIDSLSTDVLNAKNAGLMPGDTIIQADGKNLFGFGQLTELMNSRKNDSILLTVSRNGELVSTQVAVDSLGKIGFYAGINLPANYDSTLYTLASSVSYGSRDAFQVFYYQAIGVWKLITGQVAAKNSVQSPIGITKYFPKVWDWAAFWKMTALLSMVLAFMNLLPIPALDGGHILFIGIESITRKKLSEKFLERAQVVGMILLLSLMVFAVGNDILKMFK